MGAHLDLLHTLTHCKDTINWLYFPNKHAQCCSPAMPKERETSQALGRSGEARLMSILKGFCRVMAREPLLILTALTAGRRAQTGGQTKPSACSLWHLTSPQRSWFTDSDPSGSYSSYCPFTHISAFSKECLLLGPSCMLLQLTPPRILSPTSPHQLQDTATYQQHSASLCVLVQPSKSFLCLPSTLLWYQLDQSILL